MTYPYHVQIDALWKIWCPQIKQILATPPVRIEVEISKSWQSITPMTSARSPLSAIPMEHWPAVFERILDLAHTQFGQNGVLIAGSQLWKGCVQAGYIDHLAKGKLYQKCLRVFESRMYITQHLDQHKLWMRNLVNRQTLSSLDLISHCRAAASVFNVAPALYTYLHPQDQTHISLQTTPLYQLSKLVVGNMTMYSTYSVKPADLRNATKIRQQLRGSKTAIRDYVQAFLATTPVDPHNASLVLNIIGWLDHHKVRSPQMSPQVRAALITTTPEISPILKNQEGQLNKALSRLRQEALADVASTSTPSSVSRPGPKL